MCHQWVRKRCLHVQSPQSLPPGCCAGDQHIAVKQQEAREAAVATCRTIAAGPRTAGGRPAPGGRHQAAAHVGGRACGAAGFGSCSCPGADADVMQMDSVASRVFNSCRPSQGGSTGM